MTIPRLLISGTSSGVGKTTVVVALTLALRRRGLRVAAFKCGPDYLDPTYHARAAGAASQNLDGWMMGREAVLSTFTHASRGADVALIEGMMGLFDGADPSDEQGSSAEIAKWLGAPVALVVDAAGMARSIAAMTHGFATFDPALRLSCTLANRVGGRMHVDLLRRAQPNPPLLGGLPLDAGHAFPERHLGLRTADEATVPEALLDHWANLAEAWLDVDLLLRVAHDVAPLATETARSFANPPSHVPRSCRIGLAKDAAFHFYYADNLRRLEDAGAELVPFSPLSDARLPDVDGLYLGGGYPELFARALSSNRAMLRGIAQLAEAGAPLYAECGGLMLLTQAIVDSAGVRHPMVGLLAAEAHMRARLQALGYVDVETQVESFLGPRGTRFRGHEFRYSELVASRAEPPNPAYSLRKRQGGEAKPEGHASGSVVASYVHAHWASNPDIPRSIVRACARHREKVRS